MIKAAVKKLAGKVVKSQKTKPSFRDAMNQKQTVDKKTVFVEKKAKEQARQSLVDTIEFKKKRIKQAVDKKLKDALKDDIRILEKKLKAGKYNRGGLATKKYANPVTFIDNLKNKKK